MWDVFNETIYFYCMMRIKYLKTRVAVYSLWFYWVNLFNLKHLLQVSRHGNRGAIADYINDPYPLNNPHYWPYGPAGLTPVSSTAVIAHETGCKNNHTPDAALLFIIHFRPHDITKFNRNILTKKFVQSASIEFRTLVNAASH